MQSMIGNWSHVIMSMQDKSAASLTHSQVKLILSDVHQPIYGLQWRMLSLIPRPLFPEGGAMHVCAAYGQ